MIKVTRQDKGENYNIYLGDSVPIIKGIPDSSVGYSIFSPPFLDLFTYSDKPEDIGNCTTIEEFFEHFDFIIKELLRIVKPGRSVSIHCIDVPAMKERDGYIGLKDFPGDIIRAFQKHGFIYHSRNTIWKNPLIEATRTKALGLMYKQLRKDSAICRAGLPDYLITMRKPGENKEPITHDEGLDEYEFFGSNPPLETGIKRQHEIWRRYASPIATDIRQSNTLQKNSAREEKDEKHICPLQLDTIARGILLWSNPGDVVFSPFMGIGSEIYQALLMERKGIGIELKESYYKQAAGNLKHVKVIKSQRGLFDEA